MKRLLSIICLSIALLQPIVAASAAYDTQEISVPQQPSVSAGHGSILISSPADGHTYTFNIYSITGQLVKRVQISQTSATIDLPSGCYIVKCERWSKKVMVS